MTAPPVPDTTPGTPPGTPRPVGSNPWWFAAGRAYAIGLVGTLVIVWYAAFPGPFLRSGWLPGLVMLACLGALTAMLDRRPAALGGLVLGVAAAVGADLLVVVRSAGSNGMAFIDPIRTPEAWRSELTGDLQLGLVVAGVAWLVVAGLVTVRRRGSDGPEQDRRRRSSAVVATPGLIGAALLVGVWALPALVAEASRTEVVVPAGVQRLAATLHADSVSITPATVHPGPVWITTSTDVPAAAFPDSSLEGPYGPLGDTHLASLAPGPLDPEILGTLPRPGWGAYATTSLGAGRYAWLVTRWQDPQTLILERVAMMVVDSSPAPAIGPPLAPEAPVFEGAMNLILVAAGLAFAAIAAGWRRPGAVPRGQGPRLVNGPRLVLIVLLGGGAPLLLAGLMAFYVELVANPF